VTFTPEDLYLKLDYPCYISSLNNQINNDNVMFAHDTDVVFGVFTMLAPIIEGHFSKNLHIQLAECKSKLNFIFNFIRWIFVARFENVSQEKIDKEIKQNQFTAKQEEFIKKWINKEINFVK